MVIPTKKGGARRMSIGAWIMLFFYVVVLGGGSLFLIAYSMMKDEI